MSEENSPLQDPIESTTPDDGQVDHAIDEISQEEATAGVVGVSSEDALAEANERILKLHAELENVRKRVQRDADDRVRYASLPLMHDLLEVLDNFKRGIEAAKKSDSTDGLIEGVEMVAKMFEDTLSKHHCKPISALGEEFDPNYHEAISQMPSEEVQKGFVLLEATQGFKLHDRVVRPSQVIVSTGSATQGSDQS